MNWHNLQGLLLGCPANVLFILDCCYADLAVSNRGNADNWMFGATNKTEEGVGAAYNSFTSLLTKELERCAHRFYTEREETSVQSLHSSLSVWGRDLKNSPILTRLSTYEYLPIKLVPDARPRLRVANTHPIGPEPAPRPDTSRARAVPVSARKKENVYGRLKSYDTKLLIDDSASMWGENWETVKRAVAAIAPIAVQYDRDGIDVQFFTEFIPKENRYGLRSASEVMALFEEIEPDGDTPTADKLKEELAEYCRLYNHNRDIKGLNLIVFTDGDPSPGQDVKSVLVEFAQKLKNLDAPEFQVGVQFVQIGDDEKATNFLRSLDDDLKGPYELDRDVCCRFQAFEQC